MKRKILVCLVALSLLVTACSGSQPAPDLDAIVQATFQALTAQAPAPQATPTVAAVTTGSISGKLSYPSEGTPPQLVVAFSVETDNYYWVQTAQGQSTYQLDGLPTGTYHVVAYALPDGKLAGRHDQFYLCGLNQGCVDDSWVDVQVQAGVVTPDVDPGNWYIGEEYYPPMPGYDAAQPSGSGTYSAPMPALGSISGQLSYPSSFIPSMVVAAFEVKGAYYQYVITVENSSTYTIEDLPAGSWLLQSL